MKRKISALLAILAVSLCSCSTEDTVVTPQQSLTRAAQNTDNYAKDENILQNYVCINKTDKQYYMSYQQTSEILGQVSPTNKARFEKRLEDLNRSIKEALKQPDQSIYLETRNDRYFSDNDDSITATQASNTQSFRIAYLEGNNTSFFDLFYANTHKAHSIIRVSTTSYDDPIQMTIHLKHSVAGKGTKRKVFIASPVRVINALINWTYQYPNGSQSSWPLNVTKNKNVTGTISFYPGHIGSLIEIQ